jgi:hypothetical protein
MKIDRDVSLDSPVQFTRAILAIPIAASMM